MLNRALIRDGATGAWLAFSEPEAVLVAAQTEEVMAVLGRVDAFCREGGYAAGYLTYEAGAGMDSAYACHASGTEPLAVFGLFCRPVLRIAPMEMAEDDVADPVWAIDESYSDYQAKLAAIRAGIGRGDLYQANYTLRFQACRVDPEALFRRVGSGAIYGAYLDLGERVIVSASPELFFRLDGDRLISVPMKGTVARGDTPDEDRARKRWLGRSAKNRAENLMITDMVRNDIGRIAEPGSVHTESVFEVRPLHTVWQMTSTVSGRVPTDLAGVFRALYPAASITGAPKVASMALIRHLESTPRGVYTGAIGFVGPGNPGLRAQFNVAIRTAWIDRAGGRGVYGAGGGIVWDSDPEEEYEEVALKARVLHADSADAQPDFELLETLGWSPERGYDYLEAHLIRLRKAADHFGFPLDLPAVRTALAETGLRLESEARSGRSDRWRVRLCAGANGRIDISTAAVMLSPDRVTPVMPAAEPVASDDVNLTFKTTRRGVYERAAGTVPEGVEALLWNERGHVTESAIANLVYELEGRRFTPPLADGLLPGVLRGRLLESGQIAERALHLDELDATDGLYLVNALRGWRRAELLPRR